MIKRTPYRKTILILAFISMGVNLLAFSFGHTLGFDNAWVPLFFAAFALFMVVIYGIVLEQ